MAKQDAMPTREMKAYSRVMAPADAVVSFESKPVPMKRYQGDSGPRVQVAAGTVVDVSKFDAETLGRMQNKQYPAFVEMQVVIDDGVNTLIKGIGSPEAIGMKIKIEKSVGRDHDKRKGGK